MKILSNLQDTGTPLAEWAVPNHLCPVKPCSNPSSPAPLSPADPLQLAERYPACFNWQNPQPLKLGLHRELMATDFQDSGMKLADLKRAMARYCNRPRYLKALRAGVPRIDLQGQPAGVVTDEEVAMAQVHLAAWKAQRGDPPAASRTSASLSPPNDTPVPKEHLVPGRLELTVKFSELPRPLAVQDGVKIGIETGEGVVTAILPRKIWRKLEQAAQEKPHWVAALSGALERATATEITLKYPTLQVFEKKSRPDGLPAGEATAPKAHAVNTPEAVVSTPTYPRLSLKGRRSASTSNPD